MLVPSDQSILGLRMVTAALRSLLMPIRSCSERLLTAYSVENLESLIAVCFKVLLGAALNAFFEPVREEQP